MAYKRRFKKAKRRRQTAKENSSWVALTPAQFDPDDLQLVPLSGAGTLSTYLTINPVLEAEENFGGTLYPSSYNLVRANTVRLMRFDGKLRLILPKVYNAKDDSWDHDALFVYYAWRRAASNAEDAVEIAAGFDPLAKLDDGQESYKAMTMRGPQAPLKWGTLIIQPNYTSTIGRFVDGQVGTGDFGLWASHWAAEFGQRLVEANIPFPRLPAGGLILDRDNTLRLEIQVKKIHTNDTVASSPPALDSPIGEAQQLYLLPFFRYLISFDD